MLNPAKNYLLFDDECNFSKYWAHWIFTRDHQNKFLFAPIKSQLAQQFLSERGLQRKQNHHLFLWKPQRFYYEKSQAVSEAAKILGGRAGLFAYAHIFPRFFSDIVYERILRQQLTAASENQLAALYKSSKFIS